MSGHSKWSTIKRQKGTTDQKRGLVFTKLGNAITLAVKAGGGIADPESNFKLRLVIEAARAANMPKENIERAIDRASAKSADDVIEVVYEGFGPSGFSVIVEAITDNKQRTTPLVKNIFEKNEGSMGTPGSVSYLYQQKGLIVVQKNDYSPDDIFLAAVDAGAEDIDEAASGEVFVTVAVSNLSKVKSALENKGYKILSSELTRIPTTSIPLAGEASHKADSFIEKLEELDDVQKVYANYEPT